MSVLATLRIVMGMHISQLQVQCSSTCYGFNRYAVTYNNTDNSNSTNSSNETQPLNLLKQV